MSETTEKSTVHVSLKKISFIYGPRMQNQWVENNTKLLIHVGTKIGPNVTASIEAKELIVAEVDPDELLMLKME